MFNKSRLVRWDITKRCNLSCQHCITHEMYTKKIELSSSEKHHIIDKMADAGVGRIHLLGGEPTVLKDIEEYIRHMFDRDMYISMNTNGKRLANDFQLSKSLAEMNVGISFSIDGSNQVSHDTIRGTGSFNEVVNATKLYSSHLKNLNNEMIIAFYHTLTPVSIDDDFEELFILAEECGVNNIVMGALIPMGAGETNFSQNTITAEDILEKSEEILKISKKFPDIKLSFPYQTPMFVEYMNKKFDASLDVVYSKCKSCRSEFQLQPDGSLYPCIFLNDKYRSTLGYQSENEQNLLKHSFDNIVSNTYFKHISTEIDNKSSVSHVEPCNECEYNIKYDICRPCSFQHDTESSARNEFHRNLLCSVIKNRREEKVMT